MAACTVTAFVAPARAAEPTPPTIEVASPIFDFGAVAEGTRVKHDFEVTNTGSVELVIQQVVPACGCTAAVAQDSKVPPGGKTVIHVEFDTTGFSGSKTKEARINSNDPLHPSVFVTLKGVVETAISVDPARIQFGEFVSSPDVALPEGRGSVHAKGSTEIISVITGSPALTVTTIKSSPTQLDYVVKPAEGVPPGDIRDRVIVAISKGGEKREISVPVIGRAIGPIVLRPSAVAMGIISGDTPIERPVQLQSRRTVPFKIAKIETDSPAVSVNEKVIEAGKNSVLSVSVNPKLVKGDLRSTVTVTFTDESLSPLQFSVYGVQPPVTE